MRYIKKRLRDAIPTMASREVNEAGIGDLFAIGEVQGLQLRETLEVREADVGDLLATAEAQVLQLRETLEFQSFKRKARSAFQGPL